MYAERAEKLTISSNYARSRSAAGQRRLLFQTLATSVDRTSLPIDDELVRSEAGRRAFDFPDAGEPTSLSNFAATNYGDDGDEIFHNVLDILYLTRPLRDSPSTAPVHRDAFWPLEKRLHNENFKLCHLAIPGDRLKVIIKLLLAQRWDSTPTLIEAEDWNSAANSITKAFAHGSEASTSWPTFDETRTVVTVSAIF